MLPPCLFNSYLSQHDPSGARFGGHAYWEPVGKRKGDRPLGVALAGLGNYSETVLAPGLELTRHCRLAGLVSSSPEKIKTWQERYRIPDKNVYTYATFDQIANDPDIDVVYIVTPNALHAPLTHRAATAGKHVWCEKPMAMSAQEAQSMIDICRKHRVGLSIGYRLQHEPNNQQLIAWAKERPFGAIRRLSIKAGHDVYRGVAKDQRPWRLRAKHGGGAMLDMGVYTLNAARYATQAEPIAVNARSWTDRPDLFDEVDEHMHYTLEFPGDIQAECETSFGKELNALRVDCEKGWYTLEPYQSYSGIHGKASDGRVLNATYHHLQAMQMDNDAKALLEGTPFIVPGEDGLQDMRIIEAIYASARQNGQRVDIV